MFEQSVIRPPSEAESLLVRVTRNCPWNRCLFCPAYKGTTFSRRSVAEIKEDIDEMVRYHGGNGSRVTTAFFQDSDFSLNLLMHVDGYLNKDRARMLEDLDSFLSLPELDQKAYVLLQRSGHYGVHPSEMLKHQDL